MHRILPLFALPLVAGCFDCGSSPSRLVLELEETLIVDDETHIELLQGVGDTVVRSGDDPKVVLRVAVLGPEGDKRDEDALDDLRVLLADDGDGFFAESRFDGTVAGYSLRTELVVPEGFGLRVEDGSGDLDISDVGPTDLVDGSGDLVLERVEGPVRVTDGSGELTILDVFGDVAVVDDSGDLEIGNIAGDVVVDDGSGDLFVHDVTGDVVITDASGDIDLLTILGTATVSDASGDITAPGVDLVVLSDSSGDVN